MEQKSQKAIIVLIGANIVPLLGVLIFDWSIFSIMIAYWMENLVIGLYNIIKMSKAEAPNPSSISMNGKPLKPGTKKPLIAFFIMHFGIFTLVHGIFVFALFGSDTFSGSSMDVSIWGIVVMFTGLLISHGVSYKTNFIERGEYKKISPGEQMFKPYGRVVVMHAIIMGSGFLIGILGAGRILAGLLIIAKIILDYILHTKEHFKIMNSGSMSSENTTIYK
ncbi:MAG: DUF6498-containing protein [Candidatus Kerfeldbacteria bacterium]|jgi:uncharacterized protein DUF6498